VLLRADHVFFSFEGATRLTAQGIALGQSVWNVDAGQNAEGQRRGMCATATQVKLDFPAVLRWEELPGTMVTAWCTDDHS
jgi:hypothetical protein